MQSSQVVGLRKYVVYFLFIFLSGLLSSVDYFSNKALSNFIPAQVSLISNFQIQTISKTNKAIADSKNGSLKQFRVNAYKKNIFFVLFYFILSAIKWKGASWGKKIYCELTFNSLI